GDGFGRTVHAGEKSRIGVVSFRKVRIESDRPPELSLGSGPIEVVEVLDLAFRDVGLGERVVELEGLLRRSLRLWHDVLGRGVDASEERVGIREARVSGREPRGPGEGPGNG